MRGSIGLVIGVAVGAGAMYLALQRPWEHRVATTPSEGPPVVVVNRDAGGKPHPKKKRRPGGSVASRPGGPAAEADDRDTDDVEAIPAVPALTAADRALEWRGDDTKLPAQTIDLTRGGGDARALDDGEISSTFASQGGGVKDCVIQGATGTDLRAAITLKLVVDGHGRVTRSQLQAPHYLFEHGLLGCAQRAVGRLRFPATGAPTVVTVPINLG